MKAGGGTYYFAKRSIDADKKERWESQQKRKQLAASFESRSMQSKSSKAKDAHGEQEDAKTKERSKFEPTEVYRAKKGDRFS